MTLKILARQNYAQEAYELHKLDNDIFDFWYTFLCVFDSEVEIRITSNIARVKQIPETGNFPTDPAEFKKLPYFKVGIIQMFEFNNDEGTEPTFYPYKWNFDKIRSAKTRKLCFFQYGKRESDPLNFVAMDADDVQKVSVRMIPINPFPSSHLNNDARAITLRRPGSDHVMLSGRIWNREEMHRRFRKVIDNLEISA